MVRRISLHARAHEQMLETGDAEVWLIKITHPTLDEPVRLVTYPVAELSFDPPEFGVMSTWNGSASAVAPQRYDFLLVDAVMPGDLADQPHAAQLAVMTVDDGLAKALRSTTDYAVVDIAGVMASSPDLVEMEFLGLELLDSDIQTGQIMLNIGRRPAEQRPSIAGRLTVENAPGLFG